MKFILYAITCTSQELECHGVGAYKDIDNYFWKTDGRPSCGEEITVS